MPRLGVNIDHIATLRQARRIDQPDPVDALPILVKCGVDQVTIHLREDRRHIQDHDLKRVLSARLLPVNMEMALTDAMVDIAIHERPHTCTLVPEKREEITTEGGLDCVKNFLSLQSKLPKLKEAGIRVSLFIDPDQAQIEAALKLQADGIELHTGTYCEYFGTSDQEKEFKRLEKATRYASQNGIQVFAGHGLNMQNLPPLVKIPQIEEYNIGHSIIGRAVFVGLEKAILEIKNLL